MMLCGKKMIERDQYQYFRESLACSLSINYLWQIEQEIVRDYQMEVDKIDLKSSGIHDRLNLFLGAIKTSH